MNFELYDDMQRLVISSLCAFFLFDCCFWISKRFLILKVPFQIKSALTNNVKAEVAMEKDILAIINKAFQSHKNGDLSEAAESYENVLPFLSGKIKANVHGNYIYYIFISN